MLENGMHRATIVALVISSIARVAIADPASGGDPLRGQELYESRCVACHSVDENRVGPAHQGVYGRRAGTAQEYDYSAAVKAAGLVWTDTTLNRWLTDPEKLIPGQRMGYSVPDPKDRADLIAYLKKVSPPP
jgi:cytochrome c